LNERSDVEESSRAKKTVTSEAAKRRERKRERERERERETETETETERERARGRGERREGDGTRVDSESAVGERERERKGNGIYRVTRGQITDDNTTVALPLNVHGRMINTLLRTRRATARPARALTIPP